MIEKELSDPKARFRKAPRGVPDDRTGARERRLRLDIVFCVLKGIDERKERHVSGSPAVHGSIANMALGVAPLPERQASRRQFIFDPQ